MGETYAESAFKSKHSVGITVLKCVIVLITIVLIVLFILSGVTGLAFVGGLIVVVEYYGFARMKAEYEIVYCGGQLDFDKISGTLGSLSFSNCFSLNVLSLCINSINSR